MMSRKLRLGAAIRALLTGMLAALWLGLAGLPASALAAPLVIPGDERLPPYEFMEDGEAKGINIDLWRAIGRKLGRPVEFRLMDWGKAQAQFRDGQGDALSPMARTPEREAIYSFSQPIYSFNFSLFVRSSDAGDFERLPLSSRRIGVTAAGYPRKHFEKNHPKVQLVIVADTVDGIRRVMRGDIDAFAANTRAGEYFLQELGIRGVAPLPSPFATQEASIAVRRGNFALLAEIDAALTQLKAEGALDIILDRWAGRRIHVFSQQEIWFLGMLVLATIITIALLALLAAARYRQRSLAREVAQRQENEEALAREQVRLRAEIDKRIQIEIELRRVNAELEQANRELERFTFAMSHDLRAPLGRINSFSTLLARDYRDRLEGDGLSFLDFIRQNAIRLTCLVDDLMRHARVARNALELDAVEVQAMVDAVLAEKADDIRESGAQLRLELAPARILCDSYAMGQVLGNLVENALKYSAHAAPPVIDIGGRAAGDSYLFWVRDNGIGFDMAYHDRIFEMFRRLHTYSEYAGNGVGLALVKRAMERMEGKVWAESAPGRGACFYLELQLAEATSLASA